ncbi:MAG TPA: (d)CMP kinase [Planctomycetota bacterium]|nr:(d)CMP kinase [Planctomycetota bacterium]
MIVTIDGPAGSGKSTAAKRLAARLGFRYLDTGAMYRAVTLATLERGVDTADGRRAGEIARALRLELRPDGTVLADGRDVTAAIRTERVTAKVSEVSAHPEVRAAMTGLQREIGRGGDLVCEGRDMGTVVFPDAALKIWLDAPPEVRAERRRRDLEAAGESLSREELTARLVERDRKDSSRAAAPLRKADDQETVDTGGLTLDQTVERLAALAEDRRRRLSASRP